MLDNRCWTREDPPRVRLRNPELPLLIAASCGVFLSWAPLTWGPFYVGALIDGAGFSETSAGALSTVELLALAAGSLLLAPPLLARFALSRVALCGGLVAVAGGIVSVLDPGALAIGAGRATAGLGIGCLYAATNAAGARSSDPDRLFSRAVSGTILLFAVLSPVISMASRWGGYVAVYLGVAAIVGVFAPAMRGLGAERAAPDTVRSGEGEVPRRVVIFFAAAMGLYNVGTGAVWTFTERVGVRVGLSVEQIGVAIGLSGLVGLLGSMLAPYACQKLGRTGAAALGYSVCGVSAILLTHELGQWMYLIGLAVYWTGWMYIYPVQLAAAGELDPSGRLAARLGGVLMLTYALGPIAGGAVVEHVSYPVAGWLAAFFCVSSILAFLPVGRAVTR